MEKIFVLHGLDHDKMGKAGGAHAVTMEELNELMREKAKQLGVEVEFFQNNDSAVVCKKILALKSEGVSGIVFNPAEWMTSGEAIAAALAEAKLPCVEVHMGNPCKKADTHNVIAPSVTGLVTGFDTLVYPEGMGLLVAYLRKA